MNRSYPESDIGERLFGGNSINGEVIRFMYIDRLNFVAFAMVINLIAYEIKNLPLNLV